MKTLMLLTFAVVLAVPIQAAERPLDLRLLQQLEEAAFPQVTPCNAIVPSTFDTCTTCQERADEEISIVFENGGSACEAYDAGATWCGFNCSPCSFCVRYHRIATYYCTSAE